MNIYEFTGKKFKSRRKELFFSQKFVAEMACVSIKRLSKIEEGKSNFGIILLFKISEILKISPSEIFKDFE